MFVRAISVLLAISVNFCYSNPHKNMEWDHYVFMQQYPAGLCAYNSHNCVDSDMSNWTIHGLWPTFGNTDKPQHCNDSYKFEVAAVRDLLPKLRTEWTDWSKHTPYYHFWEHEWCTHGTCSPYTTEHSYFEAVLTLFSKLNYGRVLSAANIMPSRQAVTELRKKISILLEIAKRGNLRYINMFKFWKPATNRLNNILNAFRKNLSVTSIKIECLTSNGVQYLTQVAVCLDKMALYPINCPSNSSSCSSQEPIMYAL